jgi:alpha-galactosidase
MNDQRLRIALLGAGSRSFGPATVRDVLLSEALERRGVALVLMDVSEAHLRDSEAYTRRALSLLDRCNVEVEATTSLERALEGADFVVSAIEVNRFLYWSQDFHVPRELGSSQVFGENGGPGGLFHAMRNIPPTLRIAREMERRCPSAWLLNYTNPEHWLVEAVSRLTSTKTVGLCHGVFMGQGQIARLLGRAPHELLTTACGMNHFTFFQSIRDRATGEDLYPALREADRAGDLLHDFHDLALSRIVFRRFGLWPSPAANHIGEYFRWAAEFVASEMQYFYDPADGHPWQTGVIPEFVYHAGCVDTHRPLAKAPPADTLELPRSREELEPSGELAIPLIEGLRCGVPRELDAVNVPNAGAIPGLDAETVVEVPAIADSAGLHPARLAPLPEGIRAMLALQGSIRKIGIEAYQEQSRNKLLQALLLDPTIGSYRQTVALVDRMLELQKDILPRFV